MNERRWEAARTFARLLAGDIRLYNEEAVVTGRRRGDLALRLAEPIQQARDRYLSRYSQLDPSGRLLRAELLQVVAGGDEALLATFDWPERAAVPNRHS
jgi:hypothetical protein